LYAQAALRTSRRPDPVRRRPRGSGTTGKGTLADFIQRAVFPFSQGAPALNTIAAKARALEMVATAEFREMAKRTMEIGRAFAETLTDLGYRLVSGGTDNHIVLVDLSPKRMTGFIAERALEECGIIVNKNRVPRDTTPAFVTGGIRIGTNSAGQRGFGRDDSIRCAELIDLLLRSVEVRGEQSYRVPPSVRTSVRTRVTDLCARYPLPGYPAMELVRRR
jgi:glycine hydroxymethyltransferase